MLRNYFLLLMFIGLNVLHGQKNTDTQTLFIKFDENLDLLNIEDVFQIEGIYQLSVDFPFRVKKGLSASKEKNEKLSTMNKSIKNIFRIETHLSFDETNHLIKDLNNLKNVIYCYRKIKTPVSSPPWDIAPTTPNFEESQSYLESDPGINMRYAWNKGANGSGINIKVIEFSININHEDLNSGKVGIATGMTVHPSVFDQFGDHGTLTAGVIIADKGDYGASGLAFNANEYILYPEYTVENLFDPTLAVSNAIADSHKGDIIIYEMQTYSEEGNLVPQEYEAVIWDLTKAATENGIIVVAAAGNGAQNLDDEKYSNYLNRGDSGAIIVGAGTPDLSHDAFSGFTNYGKRVNVQGWGMNVFSTGLSYDEEPFMIGQDINQSYWNNYAGTSSATAVIGGCVATLQSYYLGLTGEYLTSKELRDILINTGIPQGKGGHIGPLPNMQSAINAINQILEIEEYNLFNIYVSPNPADDYININFTNNFSYDHSEINLYNILGQKVLRETFQSDQGKIDIHNLKNGIYILTVENGSRYITKKIIIN